MTAQAVRLAERKAALAQRRRVVIASVTPQIDGGRFAVKRIVGDHVDVDADAFADGHDALSLVLHYRHESERDWSEAPMEALVNDRWRGSFPVTQVGRYLYVLEGWVDAFGSWRRDLGKRLEAEQDISIDLQIGSHHVEAATAQAPPDDARRLREWGDRLASGDLDIGGLDRDLAPLMQRYAPRPHPTRHEPPVQVWVDPQRARASAWYELFPRSTSPEAGRHGTLRTCADRLPYVRDLGFDVVYLPPIHPIGGTHRKGRNNRAKAEVNDVGSPWAIGGPEGGHKSIHPDLGTFHDFDHLVATARKLGLDVALDIAFQCSPDHPYVKDHPEWFRHRPDGTIQYAENPPKKYQDIYPFDFESEDADGLWAELKSIFDFWIGHGVSIFRVDNPHTKPFPFWEWVIGEVKKEHPDVLFLAEAFTRPKVMYRLAKLGFSHSYTYFAWRNTKWELTQYFTELAEAPVRDFFRPHLWVNTPDILTEYLQTGGRPAFIIRFVLAATLGANYGVYGPAFELMEPRPLERGKEEYLDSEKYQVRHWDLDRRGSLRPFVAHLNRVRRENPALLDDRGLRFHRVDNEHILCYSKRTTDRTNTILVVVNLDPHHVQTGWTQLDLTELGVDADQGFQVHDLLTGARYLWHGPHNYVELRLDAPAHVFRVRRRVRTERDFDYFG